MKVKLTVIFEPYGLKVIGEKGKSILQIAKSNGIQIRSECGGYGLCGKCKVILKHKFGSANEVTDVEKEKLKHSEIKTGYRLACQCFLDDYAIVYIPNESRTLKRKILSDGSLRNVEIFPIVEKFCISLSELSLSDLKPDFERIEDVLSKTYGLKNLKIPIELLTILPIKLREFRGEMTIGIWNKQRIVSIEPKDSSNDVYGVAVDIGTSKIVCYLVNLTNGEIASIHSSENPQIIHGEDVVSRITYSMKSFKNVKDLQMITIGAINELISKSCQEKNIKQENVYEVVVIGNTVMHHLFIGIPPKYLAEFPYIPTIRRQIDVKAKELGININPLGNIHIFPVISGFVGADAVSVILATGIYESSETILALDIGTNTEIILGNKDWIIATSCASGPAFEGAHIKHGMKAVEGAIERVKIDPETFEVEYKTIDNIKPIGICGSAINDIIADMLKCGIIDNRGQFINLDVSRFKDVNGQKEFVIAYANETAIGTDITISRRDIEEIQLAKSAIYAGISIIMKTKNLTIDDIDAVYIAGAFGNSLNPENAIIVGLIPDIELSKIKFVGNAAGLGAVRALISKKERQRVEEILKRVECVELSTNPDFRKELAMAMYLPHWDIERFPSVKSKLNYHTQ